MNPQVAAIVTTTLSNGATLSLISVGFVVVYRATKVVSFAQGAFSIVAALILQLMVQKGTGLYLAVIVAVLVTAALGGLVYRTTLTRMVGAEPFVAAMATIGLGTLLQACSIMIGGSAAIVLPNVLPSRSFDAGGINLSATDIFTIVFGIIVLLAVVLVLHGTRFGLQMRAVADQPRLAAYTGVRVVAIATSAWALGAGAAGAAGVEFVMTTQPTPSNIFALALGAFPAILLGGFDSVLGAIIGGVAVALIQAVVSTLANGKWQDIATYFILLLTLLIRPQGLLGSREVTRV